MNDYIYHHGVKGQKWGVRREENEGNSPHKDSKKTNQPDLNNKKSVGKKVLIGLGITGAAAGTVASAVALKKIGEELLVAGALAGLLSAMSKLSG